MASASVKTVTATRSAISQGGCIVTLKAASGDIAIGGDTVTLATGLIIKSADGPLSLLLGSGETLHAIAAASQTVQVLETS